jgi:hypothetical protein
VQVPSVDAVEPTLGERELIERDPMPGEDAPEPLHERGMGGSEPVGDVDDVGFPVGQQRASPLPG